METDANAASLASHPPLLDSMCALRIQPDTHGSAAASRKTLPYMGRPRDRRVDPGGDERGLRRLYHPLHRPQVLCFQDVCACVCRVVWVMAIDSEDGRCAWGFTL